LQSWVNDSAFFSAWNPFFLDRHDRIGCSEMHVLPVFRPVFPEDACLPSQHGNRY
jgi:hypothetical protein